MVDITDKKMTQRVAIAAGFVSLNQSTLALIQAQSIAKGDVLSVSRVAGIMAAKKTSELIPLCHDLQLTHVDINLVLHADGIDITAVCKTAHATGVEMEALTAVTHSALCIYDMCKALQRDIKIGNIRLLKKYGGKSGSWINPENMSQEVSQEISH